MKNILQYTMMLLLTLCLLPACSEDDNHDVPIRLTNGTQKEQTFYADDGWIMNCINFTADGPWEASIQPGNSSASNQENWIYLSSTSGEAGDFSLHLLLQPNETGNIRTARILLRCEMSQVRITVTQQATNSDGSHPAPPTNPNLKGNVKYIRMTEYDEYKTLNKVNEITFLYNNDAQVKKVVCKTQKQEGNGTISTQTDSISITRGNQQVSYTIQSFKNGTRPNGYVKGDIELSPKNYALRGTCETYDADNRQTGRSSYELFYTSESLLSQTRITTKEQTKEYRFTWSNGNPTQMIWGNDNGISFTETASFTSIVNITNIDLNWLLMMPTKGWAAASGDVHNIFSMLGYTGKRSKNMVNAIHETDNTNFDRYHYDFVFNRYGQPIQIVRKDLEELIPEYVGCEIIIYYYE